MGLQVIRQTEEEEGAFGGSHLEIEEYLIRLIKKNGYRDDFKLPSENSLSAAFHVNRNVVRKAMDRLRHLGWIYSVKGKGFFVCRKPDPILYPVFSKSCFTDNLSRTGRKYESRLLDWNKVLPAGDERKCLNIGREEPVYRLEILRIVDGEPLCVYTSTLPEKVFRGLENHLEGFVSLYSILRQHYGFSPVCRAQTIEATFPSKKDIRLLQVTEHISILKSVSINVDTEDRPVEYCVSRARGDRYKYILKFNN